MITTIFNSVNKTVKEGFVKMGLYDRDWYRDGYEEKYKKYNGDFSLHSKPQKQKNNKDIHFEECKYCKRTVEIKQLRQLFDNYYWDCPYCHKRNRKTHTIWYVIGFLMILYVIIQNII